MCAIWGVCFLWRYCTRLSEVRSWCKPWSSALNPANILSVIIFCIVLIMNKKRLNKWTYKSQIKQNNHCGKYRTCEGRNPRVGNTSQQASTTPYSSHSAAPPPWYRRKHCTGTSTSRPYNRSYSSCHYTGIHRPTNTRDLELSSSLHLRPEHQFRLAVETRRQGT